MAATQDEVPAGNVAKLVNRLSKDLSKETMAFRKPTSLNTTKLATVRYSYHAAQDDELNLKVDDVIEVIEDAESGWMKGKLRSTGQIGLFPTNFVQFSEGQQLSKNGVCKADLKKKTSEHTSDNSPEALQRSALSDNQKKRSAPAFSSSVVKKGDEGDGDGSGMKEMARVLYPYTPNHDDELALKEVGTMIIVIKKTCSDPGWFLGEIDGKRGLIPDNFVEFLKVPATASEEKKSPSVPMSSVPNVPAKPAKPPGLIGVANATKHLSVVSNAAKPPGSSSSTGNVPRSGSRVLDTAFANTLAEALNKQQKQFGLKPAVKYEEGPADTRTDGPLEHITTSRPKQPNKRPPSTIFNKRKSNDVILDSSISEFSEADPSLFSKKTVASTSLLSQSTLFNLPPTVPLQTASANKAERGDDEYVSYAEFKRLSDRFQEFQKEMQSRIAQLEAKIASMK